MLVSYLELSLVYFDAKIVKKLLINIIKLKIFLIVLQKVEDQLL